PQLSPYTTLFRSCAPGLAPDWYGTPRRSNRSRSRGRAAREPLELTLTDVHLGQVVHRPGVTLIQHDRFLVRFDRTARVAQLALHPAEQAVSLVRRRIDGDDPLDVGKRFLRLALLDQHPAQVQAALHVRRILFQRLRERAHRRIAVTRLPGREAEHVEAPDVVRVLARVAREQAQRFVVALLGIRRLGAVERHGSGAGGTGRRRNARRLGRHGRYLGRIRVARLRVLVPARAGDARGDDARDDGELAHEILLLVGRSSERRSNSGERPL